MPEETADPARQLGEVAVRQAPGHVNDFLLEEDLSWISGNGFRGKIPAVRTFVLDPDQRCEDVSSEHHTYLQEVAPKPG